MTQFKCEALNCTLSQESCGKRWLKAESIKVNCNGKLSVNKQRFLVCKGCSIGKKNAKQVDDEYDPRFRLRAKGTILPKSA